MINKIINRIVFELYVHSQRIMDHAWLLITGFPMIRRSRLRDNLYVGSQYRISAIPLMQKLGITAVVNMRSAPVFHPEAQTMFKILHLPTPDRKGVDVEDLFRGAQFIDKEIKNGGRVYVHCLYGEGRGPSMMISYLIYTGMHFDGAYEFVRRVRVFIGPNNGQVAKIKEFEEKYFNAGS